MRIVILTGFLFLCSFLTAQDMEGAWILTHLDNEPVEDQETIKIYQDGYFAFATWNKDTKEFINAGGGQFFIDGGYSEIYDFYTEDSTYVGQEKTFEGFHRYDGLVLSEIGGGVEKAWKRISRDKDSLTGAWVITGRQRNGEMQRNTPGARRTMKILSGGHFQWIAFNSDTGEFFGSGGGTYSAENGKYTETIEFFSRDNTRVGTVLPFEFKLNGHEWHHSGKSSKGDPINEIWSPYRDSFPKEE